MSTLSATWRIMFMMLLGLAIETTIFNPAMAQQAEGAQRSFLLSTGSTGGMSHPMGVALSTLIKLKLLPRERIDLTAINSQDAPESLQLMRDGEVQFAIIPALTGYQAVERLGPFADQEEAGELRAVGALWFSTDHVVIRKDSVQTGTISDLAALRGQAMAFGEPGTDELIGNQLLMGSLGFDIERDFNLRPLDLAASAEALISGEIAGMSVTDGVPVEAIEPVFEALGDEAVVLEFDDKQLTALDQGRRLWGQVVIPAGTYPGQTRDIFSVGTPNMLVTRADVDDEVVYEITKTIFEELDYLQGLHPITEQISLDNAARSLPLPLHEGALRYFEEKGVELPAPPVQVNPDLLARFDNTNDARDSVNLGLITMFTGASGETSARTASELAMTLNGPEDAVTLSPTFGGGTGRNLTDLLYRRGVDSAIVRTDTVGYAIDQGIYPDFQSKITYIAEMFPEEMHLVVRDGIGDIGGLVGKKVSLGAPGSGSDITASIILAKLDIAVEPLALDHSMALDALQRGEIDGAFLVGGKPMPRLKELDEDAGLRLLPIPFVQNDDHYQPAVITKQDYPNLMPDGTPDSVTTMSVRTALLTYAWRQDSERYEALGNFSRSLFEHLSELQQAGHHPKWRAIDPTANIASLTRFQPAEAWVEENAALAERIAQEGQERLGEPVSTLPDVAPGIEESGIDDSVTSDVDETAETDPATLEDGTANEPAVEASPTSSSAVTPATGNGEAADASTAKDTGQEGGQGGAVEPIEESAPAAASNRVLPNRNKPTF